MCDYRADMTQCDYRADMTQCDYRADMTQCDAGVGMTMLIVAADFFIGKAMFSHCGRRKRAVLCGRLSFMLRALRRLGMRLFFGQRGISTMVWSTVSSAISFRSFRWRVRSRMSSVCGIGSC